MKRALCTASILLLAIPLSFAQKGAPPQGKVTTGPAAKISSNLRGIARAAAATSNTAAAVRSRAPWATQDAGNSLRCIIAVKQFSPKLTAAIKGAGHEIVDQVELPGGIRHIVVKTSSPAALESIAGHHDVIAITEEPKPARRAGLVPNQADVSIRANLARSTTGMTGAGVRVGVLSDTFHRVIGGTLAGGQLTNSSPQVTGDLPPSVRVIDAGPASGSDEGAGMAELIYDLAPGAALSFASAFSGYSEFANNITALRNDPGFNCDVIVDDVYYFVEPIYQNGPIAIAANAARAAGVPYFSSAGNDADDAHERPFLDANPILSDAGEFPSGSDLHNFGLAAGVTSDTHLSISLPNNGEVYATLHWDEPYGGIYGAGPGAEADLDIYLVRNLNPISDSNIAAYKTNFQGTLGAPAGEAVEDLYYQNTSGVTQNLHLVINHYHGRSPVNLHLAVSLTAGSIIDKAYVSDRTVFGHAAASGVMSVAAMFYGEIDANGNLDAPNGQLDVEAFSSKGGLIPYYFPDSGAPRLVVPQFYQKPDITAPDGTNTTFFGQEIGFDPDVFPNFFGTSAAAPHAAAVAALMLQANPSLTPFQIEIIMKSTAREAEAIGVDAYAGYGLIDAKNAVDAAMASSVDDWQLYD